MGLAPLWGTAFATILLSSRAAGLCLFSWALISFMNFRPVGCAALSAIIAQNPEPAASALNNIPIFAGRSRIPAGDTDLGRIAGRFRNALKRSPHCAGLAGFHVCRTLDNDTSASDRDRVVFDVYCLRTLH